MPDCHIFFSCAVVYGMTDPSDDYCYVFKSPSECLREPYYFYEAKPRCNWNGYICRVRLPYESITSIVISGFVASIIGTPFYWTMRALLVDCVFKHTRKPIQAEKVAAGDAEVEEKLVFKMR